MISSDTSALSFRPYVVGFMKEKFMFSQMHTARVARHACSEILHVRKCALCVEH